MEEKDFYQGWTFNCNIPQGRTYFIVDAYNPLTNEKISVDVKSSCPKNCTGCKKKTETKIKNYLISPTSTLPEMNHSKPNPLEKLVTQPQP